MFRSVLVVLTVLFALAAAHDTFVFSNTGEEKVEMEQKGAEIMMKTDEMAVIVDHDKNMMVVKPGNEDTCIVIEQMEDLPSQSEMQKMMEAGSSNMPEESRMLKLKQSEEKGKADMSEMASDMCKKHIRTTVTTQADEAKSVFISETKLTSKRIWWPWYNWWFRPCPYCFYSYRWPCFYWPYWFYYYRWRWVIYPFYY